ncbi:MAG: WecB/TagA/CpsF family glycosyltransferase [Lachnospiraceae bacterium]|nr:WecB/TagA/CpsF family glycosyltransferase [Lachnospiraceae bacterium]
MQKTNHTCDCFGLQIVATNLKSAIHTTCRHLEQWRGKYITFVNVHALMTAVEEKEYFRAQELAVCNFADGMPIVYLQKKQDYIQAARVAGPDFMDGILKLSGSYRHFFYGSSKETLDRLIDNIKEKYPDIQIAGSLAPDFVETIEEDSFATHFDADIQKINESNPDFIWVGLGAPKQELFMMHASGKVNGLMLGVGAAFDFLAGTQKRAPKWMQVIGLEWLFRLASDPKRLWKRYVVTNVKFLFYGLWGK